MSKALLLDIRELRSLVDVLFDAVAARGVEHLALSQSQYWDVYFEDAFALHAEPKLVVGDLRDDVADLRKEASELSADLSRADVTLWHAFHHLSGLIKFLAQSDLSGLLRSGPHAAPEGA